ncbi:MAG: hypothetical protein ABIP42_01045, partial [Planctomycetota bacterium]
LLELNYAVAWQLSSSDDTADNHIEELLGGKHVGKTKKQLLRSLKSVDAVLEAQRNPEALPKDKVLSPEALSALEIERTWLKEKVYNN